MALFAKMKSAVRSALTPGAPSRGTPATVPDPLDGMIPDHTIAEYVGGGDAETFKLIGRLMVGWLQDFGSLQPHERVLEVGCGIGRIAIPLTQYLQQGSYVGFDVVLHGIEWCRERVTPRYSNFTFFHSDIYNKAYNPTGAHAAHEYAFPFPDGSFDFVFLTSVFTHMLPRDVAHYTAEIGRVLKPGGRCFCTAYLMNEEARGWLDRGESVKAFIESPGGYWTTSPDVPEAAVALDEAVLFGVFRSAHLEIRRKVAGDWWKNPTAQDIFVAEKLN